MLLLVLLAANAVLNQTSIGGWYGSLAQSAFGPVSSFINQYGYLAIFLLLLLESASLPIPSEVVLPVVGFVSYAGRINPVLAFLVVILGGMSGMWIDYSLARFFGREMVYKRLSSLHMADRKALRGFDAWFKQHGRFAVFVARLLPVVRGFINFPAGFAAMPLGEFYTYSVAGAAIWDLLLMSFGYFAFQIAEEEIDLLIAAVAILAIVVYLTWRYVVVKIEKRRAG